MKALPITPRDKRKSIGLNQVEFWSRVGVTQSGGSRYESDRAIPKTVQILLASHRLRHAQAGLEGCQDAAG